MQVLLPIKINLISCKSSSCCVILCHTYVKLWCSSAYVVRGHVIIWCLITFFIICIVSGQCGFPGRPLNSKVFIEKDSWRTRRDALNSSQTNDTQDVEKYSTVGPLSSLPGQFSQFTEEINETNWDNEELYRVVYRCDDDPLMGSDGESGYFRECIDGKWTGENPQCGKLLALNRISFLEMN